jgi:hypothetical protein
MTLTEAIRAWCDAMTDAYMCELRGFEADAAEARERALAIRPVLIALVAQGEAAISECDTAREWGAGDGLRGSLQGMRAAYNVAKSAARAIIIDSRRSGQ